MLPQRGRACHDTPMSATPSPSRSYRTSRLPLLLLLAGLLGASCKGGGSEPAATGAPSSGGVLKIVTLEDGRRQASLALDPTEAVMDLSLTWRLPEGCTSAGGAMSRTVKLMEGGKRQEQSLLFSCPNVSSGAVHVTWSGTQSRGRFEGSAEAAF